MKDFEINALNNCAKCSICVDNCPVTKVNPEFPGPKQLATDWFRIAQGEEVKPSWTVDYCNNCKSCDSACPSGILPASINQLSKSKLPRKKIAVRDFIFSNPARLGKLINILPAASNYFMTLSISRVIMEKVLGISAKAPMPVYSPKTFSQLFRHYKQTIDLKSPAQEVIYYPGCYVEYNNPETGISCIKILNKLNYKVVVPEFRCCGQPAISNSRLQEAKVNGKYNLTIMEEYINKGTPLIFTCPSCLMTFKEEYRNILEIGESKQINELLWDAGQFLLQNENFRSLPLAQNIPVNKFAYHQPCHLKASGLGTPSLELLRNIGYQVVDMGAGCCGISGSYGLKAEKQWIAQEIGKNIVDALTILKAEGVITECGMCAVQIKHLSNLPVYHPIDLLARNI